MSAVAILLLPGPTPPPPPPPSVLTRRPSPYYPIPPPPSSRPGPSEPFQWHSLHRTPYPFRIYPPPPPPPLPSTNPPTPSTKHIKPHLLGPIGGLVREGTAPSSHWRISAPHAPTHQFASTNPLTKHTLRTYLNARPEDTWYRHLHSAAI